MSGTLLVAAVGGPTGLVNPSIPSGANTLSAVWELTNNGQYSVGDGVGGQSTGNWVSPASTLVATFYEVKIDATAGSFTGGTTGSFLGLGTTRQWTKTTAGAVTFTVTIRDKASGLILSVQSGKTLTG